MKIPILFFHAGCAVSDEKTLLVVDDSKVVRMMLGRMVKEVCPGWGVEEAESGAEALEKAQAKEYDAVMIDYNMPGMDGLELAGKLLAVRADMKLAMLTANIQNAVKKGAESFNIPFMTKPTDKDEIVAFLNK